MRPCTVTTDKAPLYQPALAVVLPEVAHWGSRQFDVSWVTGAPLCAHPGCARDAITRDAAR